MGDILLTFYFVSALPELALFGVIAYTLHSRLPFNRMSMWVLVLFIACIPLINTLVAIWFAAIVIFLMVAFTLPTISSAISFIEPFMIPTFLLQLSILCATFMLTRIH